jgi:hypothetical protein
LPVNSAECQALMSPKVSACATTPSVLVAGGKISITAIARS